MLPGFWWRPAVDAQQQAGAPSFDVISIKKLDPKAPTPQARRSQGNGVFQTRATVAGLIYPVYGFEPLRTVNLPEWATRDVFEIDARASHPASVAEMMSMIGTMLAERFGLVTHREFRELPHYELRLAGPDGAFGPHLRKSDCAPAPPRPPEPAGTRYVAYGCFEPGMMGVAVGGQIQMPVVDRTGLTGKYAYQLAIPVDEPRDLGIAPSTLHRLVKEQWGLTLVPSREPIEVLVVDAVRPPTDN
jgi:uncharacterized protein (TIGR03435 family)